MFREAYAFRRCIVPVDGFFEWRAPSRRTRQAALCDRHEGSLTFRFGWAVGELEEPQHRRVGTNLCHHHGAGRTPTPESGNEPLPSSRCRRTSWWVEIHDRMPAILEPSSYARWLGLEFDPHDLLITYPSEPMTMWPISARVNKPENDDPAVLERVGDPFEVWAPL